MNVYFLVEGAKTEKKFYPALINYIFKNGLTEIEKVYEVSDDIDGFFVLSGNGYPQIYEVLENTIQDINSYPAFNYLFFCLDADEMSVDEVVKEFNEELVALRAKNVIVHNLCEIILIVQNRCIETWFLGNRSFFRRQTSNPDMLKFHYFYNVRINDPEDMGFDVPFDQHAGYHFSYFKQMANENKATYSKRNPEVVCQNLYIENLINRVNSTKHMSSFKYLCKVLNELNNRLINR